MEHAIQEKYNKLFGNYDDFIDSNFDGTQNSLSTIDQICLSGKVDNDVYTYKDMMK